MFTLIRAARAITIVCLSAVTLFGVSATATADPADNQANDDKLFALISRGYTPADCQASKPYPQDPFLARLGCGPNSQPGGPVGAIYSLYASTADLNNTFDNYVNSGAPLACPGTTDPGPTAWQSGMVVCSTARGPSEGAPMLSWTKAGDLLVVSAMGSDLDSLYAWWLTAR
jgi:hypothetical protein